MKYREKEIKHTSEISRELEGDLDILKDIYLGQEQDVGTCISLQNAQPESFPRAHAAPSHGAGLALSRPEHPGVIYMYVSMYVIWMCS